MCQSLVVNWRWKLFSQAFRRGQTCKFVSQRTLNWLSIVANRHDMICEIIPWERLHLNLRIYLNSIQIERKKNAFTIYVVMYFYYSTIWFLSLRKKFLSLYILKFHLTSYDSVCDSDNNWMWKICVKLWTWFQLNN